MMLPAILLAAALAPAPQEAAKPEAPPSAQAAPVKPASPSPAQEAAPAPGAQAAIDAGLTAFKKRRFRQAEIEFRKAMEAEPSSAAAAFYLGYTYYKMHEKVRNHPDKRRAAELFAKAFELDPRFRPVWGERKR
jgi:TolA-binding protein